MTNKESSFGRREATSRFAILIGLLFVSGGCNPTEPLDHEVRVGYLSLSAALPLFVAAENGYFRRANLKVNLVKYQNGALLAQDVIAGRIDAASPGPADVYLDAETKTPGRFRIYLQTAYTPDNYIYSLLAKRRDDLKGAADLKGKKMAVFPGMTNKLLCGLYLKKKYNLAPDTDVTIVSVAPGLQLDALEAGEFDALCPLEPTGTLALARPSLTVLEEGPVEREVVNPLYITAHALSTIALKQYPVELKAFVSEMNQAVDFIRQNEAQARELLTKYTPLNADQAKRTPLGRLIKVQEASRQDFQRLSDLLTAEGALKMHVRVDALYL